VLIPSLYATSLRAQSLRPVRVPSDQNTRWRLPHHFLPLRDKEFLVSPHLPVIYPYIWGWTIAATPHTWDRMATPLGTLWTKNYITLWKLQKQPLKKILELLGTFLWSLTDTRNNGGALFHAPPPLATRGFTRRRWWRWQNQWIGVVFLSSSSPAVTATSTCNKKHKKRATNSWF
jgi:hypothetical protein